MAVDPFEYGVEHREDLYVAVVVDCGLAVRLEMKRVYHVHIVEVGCGSLIGYVDRMFQWQTPHWERFKLGIAGLYAALVFVVQLAETYGHLAAAGAGSRYYNKRSCGLDIIVFAKALFGGYQIHVGRIAVDRVVVVGGDAETFKALTEGVGAFLPV